MTSSGYSFVIADRDEAGMRTLSDLNSRGLNGTANALARSADHIKDFFRMLRAELGFYVGCLNLRDRLMATGEPVCFPVPTSPVTDSAGRPSLAGRGLYDPCLALSTGARTVGNDVDADRKWLIMITGANQGGKSTFLRSIGLAQLMMQAGMFVAAKSFTASASTGVFTHFKREEDPTMEGGKLDEELARMSVTADQVRAGGLLLCNESFASTNEREGSEIARQVIGAFTEAGVRVVFVTHMYDLAGRYYAEHDPRMVCLRAERRPDGRRTFRLLPGEPLPPAMPKTCTYNCRRRRPGGTSVRRAMEVQIVVEIPQGSRNKYEMDHDRQRIRLDRMLFTSTRYPLDYGFIPGTMAEDGEPLDVMVMLDEPTFPGCEVLARPVGVFWLLDEHGPDAKVLAVPARDPRFGTVREFADVPAHLTAEIGQFFDIYKEIEPGKGTDVRGWQDRAAAERMITGAFARARTPISTSGDMQSLGSAHGLPRRIRPRAAPKPPT